MRRIDILAPRRGADVRAASGASPDTRGNGNARVRERPSSSTTGMGSRRCTDILATIRCKSGETVPAGAVIGHGRRSGKATTHHFTSNCASTGEAVDPVPYLNVEGELMPTSDLKKGIRNIPDFPRRGSSSRTSRRSVRPVVLPAGRST